MADIFPTGFFGARNAFQHYNKEQIAEATVVVIGCGPVGLCALVNAIDYKPKHILAVDSIESRLELAKGLGAEPWNFMKDREGLNNRVKELTDGRGADAVIEVVGLSPALQMGFELLRPWGVISSIGVHNAEVRIISSAGVAFSHDIADTVDWKPGLWQESENPNGKMSCEINLPRRFGIIEEEASSSWVRWHLCKKQNLC